MSSSTAAPLARPRAVESACRMTASPAPSSERMCTSPPSITSQNHGFAVRGEVGVRIESELGAAELTHVNLYDGTVEGIRLLDVPAGCVQYHPEAGPGPNDSLGLFDEFIDLFAANAA